MAYPKAKGTIYLKIIIGILGVALVYTIYLPGKIWEEEAHEQAECRFHLTVLVEAQDQYYRINDSYADSLEKLIQFTVDNNNYSVTIDSLINVYKDQDNADRVRVSSPIYEYHQIELSLGSVLNCSTSNEPYSIAYTAIEEEGETFESYTITCPTEPENINVNVFFTRLKENHGWINQRNETSW